MDKYIVDFGAFDTLHVEQIQSVNFQLHDLNARLTMNVLHTLHASVKNVKIRAKPIHVASTLNVWLGIIEPFVSASMDMLEILLQFVKNVSYTQKIMFGCPFR